MNFLATLELNHSAQRLGGDRFDKPYCHSPHLVRRWQEEDGYAEHAKIRNKGLVLTAKTRYRVDDVLWVDGFGGTRRQVRITEVLPAGFITVPRKYNNFGRLGEAVTCDVDTYRYVPHNDPRGATGQTTEEHLHRSPRG